MQNIFKAFDRLVDFMTNICFISSESKKSTQNIFKASDRLVDIEQSSYSAMLNIVESVPPQESIPGIPESGQT
jgi:hypothetical protein